MKTGAVSVHQPDRPLPWAELKRTAKLVMINGAETIDPHSIADEAYLLHAADAYPRLVAALKDVLSTDESGSHEVAAMSLLNELGEL